MKHSYILAGTTSGKLVKMVLKNGISLNPKLLFRLIFLMQSGVWASIFKRREKIKFGKALSNTPVPKDPIIIIGHWRTGSTLLHQLMSLDKNLIAPSVFHVSLPDSLLVSEKYYRPVMSRMMSPTRPMDNVKLGFDEPQEDEYALLKLTTDSPLERIIFQNSKGYFLKNYKNFNPENTENWKEGIRQFCQKLNFATNKRIVLKNPFHSLRIELLKEVFPEAKFIHIHRHPYKVVPSTINMWNIVARQNRLKGKWQEPTVHEIAEVLNDMLIHIRQKLSVLPSGTWSEVNFETFEKDPLNSLKKIYAEIGLEYTLDFEEKVQAYLSGLNNYKKNVFPLSDEDKKRIHEAMGAHFNYYHYSN
jgi:omega-hydroxy-beta-dihydromenaquinone-9 sulfotransferase